MMSFVFDDVNQPYRALLFVNGWQFGKASLCYCLVISVMLTPLCSGLQTWALSLNSPFLLEF